MQNKTKFATIAILGSAMFAVALTMSLAVQPAAAICSKKGACADASGGGCPRPFTICAQSGTSNPSSTISHNGILYTTNTHVACSTNGVCVRVPSTGGVGGLP